MCGITAFVGEGFSPTIFSLLCILQDARGGHGGGLLFEHEGHLVLKKCSPLADVFDNVRLSQTLPGNNIYSNELADLIKFVPESTSVAIGHARKASAGDMSEDNIAPIYRDQVVLSHNGTLYNEYQLAEEIGMDFEPWMSDSHVLAEIVNRRAYDKLSDYTGTAALVWTRLDEDGIYAYSGKSFNRIERPLHVLDLGDKFYFSSEISPLELAHKLLGKPEADIYQLKTNTVWKFDSDSISKIYEVERTTKATNVPVKRNKQSTEDFRIKTPLTSAVYVFKGRYYDQNDMVLNTEVRIDNVNNNKTVHYVKHVKISDQGFLTSSGAVHYFYDGIMFKDKESFEDFILNNSESFELADLIGKVKCPIWYGLKNNLVDSNFYISHEGFEKVLDGDYVFPYCEKCYTFKSGNVKEIRQIPFSQARILWKH